MDAMKPCSKCGQVKPLVLFTLHPATLDGRTNVCKLCNAKAKREYGGHGIDADSFYGDRGLLVHHRIKAGTPIWEWV